MEDLGLRLSGEAEIDLVLAFVSGVFLLVVICEVKRADTYPWSTSRAAPSRQAVNKAELQLTKNVDIMTGILAGTPPGQVVIRTLACFPDVSSSDLQTIFCPSCLGTVIVCQEDLSDLSLPQEKVQVLDKPNPATRDGMKSRGGRYVLKIHFFIESDRKMIQFKIQFKPKSKIFIQQNPEYSIKLFIHKK